MPPNGRIRGRTPQSDVSAVVSYLPVPCSVALLIAFAALVVVVVVVVVVVGVDAAGVVGLLSWVVDLLSWVEGCSTGTSGFMGIKGNGEFSRFPNLETSGRCWILSNHRVIFRKVILSC